MVELVRVPSRGQIHLFNDYSYAKKKKSLKNDYAKNVNERTMNTIP